MRDVKLPSDDELERFSRQLASMSPRDVRARLGEISEGLGITEPWDCPPECIRDCYQSLQEAAENYRTCPDAERPEFKSVNLEFLDTVVEVQARWFVLRTQLGVEVARALDREEQQTHYLRQLYGHRDRFLFFEPRERAIDGLHSVGIIDDITRYRL